MKKIFAISVSLLLALCSTGVFAANLFSLVPRTDDVKSETNCNRGGCNSFGRFSATWELRNKGDHHICQVKYSSNNWKSYTTVNGQFSSFSGSIENWRVDAIVPFNARIKYVITCEDLDRAIRFTDSAGVTRTTRGFKLQSPVLFAD